MNLQLFAEGGDGGTGDGANGGASTNSQQRQQSQNEGQQSEGGDGEQGTGKTFSRDEVGKMIAAETKKARASWEKSTRKSKKKRRN
ncbi:hypothetical protein [Enterococcus avium]|uniref:hypothetical protein n=1 Tax=Enterococcus avium TaxID=33945 RepID=UPI0037048AF3